MLKIIKRLRGRSVAELKFRALQALAAQSQRLWLRWGSAPAFRDDQVAPDALLFTVDATLAMLSGARQEPESFVAVLARYDDATLAVLRQRTRQLHAGHIQILGLPELAIGSTPNWHRDPVSGLIAPKLHWSRVPYLDAAVVGDHKSLWEVNRHQYLFAPALTWLADGNDADFQLVQRHLDSWLTENPPSIGVNWASSLEVAYRAITWCWLLWFLRKAPWNPAVLSRMGDALLRSGRHVERNLSIYFSPNTHLTGEALSLCYLAALLPRSAHTDRWQAKGASILEGWLARQVYDDGVYTEQAVLYQRYTAEIYLHYFLLAQASGHPVSAALTRSLNQQFDVLRSVASADSSLPMIGDDDGGQFLPLDQRSPEQVAGVLLAGATALGRPELVPVGSCLPALSYTLCGIERTNAMMARATRDQLPVWRDRYFPDGGLAVLRDDWFAEAAVAVIDAGPHGVLNCGHAHADALSMTLSLGSQPLFIDRGTLTYVGAKRNEFRSTRSHNTLEFDGESSVTPLSPFQWGPRPGRPTGELRLFEPLALFRARAPGHAGSDRSSLHRRAIAHVPHGAWVVLDVAERAGLTIATVRWQLAPGLVGTRRGPVLDIHEHTGKLVAEVAILGARSVTQSVREVSLRYGHHVAATLIEASAEPGTAVVTLVVPAGGSALGVRLTARRESFATICEFPDGTNGSHQLWVPDVAGAPMVAPGGVVAVAQALWLCARPPQAADDAPEPKWAAALGVSSLTLGEAAVFAAVGADGAVGDVVAGSTAGHWAILPGLNPSSSSESR